MVTSHFNFLDKVLSPLDTEERRELYLRGENKPHKRTLHFRSLYQIYRWDIFWHVYARDGRLKLYITSYSERQLDIALRKVIPNFRK